MTAENFEQTLKVLHTRQPYEPVTVDLLNGRRFEVDHPWALSVRKGIAVFISPSGAPVIFDHTGVLNFTAAPANSGEGSA